MTAAQGAAGRCPFNAGDQVRSRYNQTFGAVIAVDKARARVTVILGIRDVKAAARMPREARERATVTLPAADLVFVPGSYRHPEDELAAPAAPRRAK